MFIQMVWKMVERNGDIVLNVQILYLEMNLTLSSIAFFFYFVKLEVLNFCMIFKYLTIAEIMMGRNSKALTVQRAKTVR